MRGPGPYPLLWGGLLAGSAAVLWAWAYGLPHSSNCASATCVAVPYLPALLLSGAAAISILAGAALLASRRDGIDRATRIVVEQSVTTVVVSVGCGVTALSAAVGWWLLPIGLGIVFAGVGGIVREQLELRRIRGRR